MTSMRLDLSPPRALSASDVDPLERILMLVPHDPREDPRIAWVTQICRSVARTEVVSAVWSDTGRAVEYDGVVSVERANIWEVSSTRARAAATFFGGASILGAAGRYRSREGKRPARRGLAQLDHHIGAVARSASAATYGNLIVSALRRQARAVSVPPRVIICHDIYALLAASALKRQFGCPIIYDSHELWPQADLMAADWEEGLMTRLERRAIRHADAVITVSPPLGEHLESLYGLEHVVIVPNAEPFDPAIVPSPDRSPEEPVRFLLQGRVAAGRGIDVLLAAWADLEREDAVLELRCPEDPYLSFLRETFAAPIRAGRVVMRQPVSEPELVRAAATADVGIIPYVGPSLNHIYACPNKLSQYMHAGLAILANDLAFVGDVVRRYECGVLYDADRPETLHAAVQSLVEDRDRLRVMKQNAYLAASGEFNWEVQSRPYRLLLESLLLRKAPAGG